MLTTYAAYYNTVRDIGASIDRVGQEAFTRRETDYYLANIGAVKSIDEFLADTRLFNYAMKAHGLGDMAFAKALVREALEGGVDDRDAFVNRIADQRYREFAETFNFKAFDSATTSFTKAQQGVVDRYLRQQLEENAGSANEGVRLALYFERKAPDLTSVESILADSALSKVVRTALQIPDATAVLDIDKQVALIANQLDVADFAEPEKLDRFIDRFLNLWDASTPASSPVGLLFSSTSQIGLSPDLLISLQSLK